MKELFRDLAFENATQIEVEQTGHALQELVDAWRTLTGKPVISTGELYDLLGNPVIAYTEFTGQMKREAINTETSQRKAVFDATKRPADPQRVYDTAAAAKRLFYSDRKLSIFFCEAGKVSIDEESAQRAIHDRSIFAETEEQIVFAEDVQIMIDTLNRINQIAEVPLFNKLTRQYWNEILILPPVGYETQVPSSLRIEKIRGWIQRI